MFLADCCPSCFTWMEANGHGLETTPIHHIDKLPLRSPYADCCKPRRCGLHPIGQPGVKHYAQHHLVYIWEVSFRDLSLLQLSLNIGNPEPFVIQSVRYEHKGLNGNTLPE